LRYYFSVFFFFFFFFFLYFFFNIYIDRDENLPGGSLRRQYVCLAIFFLGHHKNIHIKISGLLVVQTTVVFFVTYYQPNRTLEQRVPISGN